MFSPASRQMELSSFTLLAPHETEHRSLFHESKLPNMTILTNKMT